MIVPMVRLYARSAGRLRALVLASSSSRLQSSRLVPFRTSQESRSVARVVCCHLSSSSSVKQICFDTVSEETLESLCDHFETLLEKDSRMSEADVSLSAGVLTVLIPGHGTYVLNKQSPNRQIWLSSPISGPSRFDLGHHCWLYSRTNETLHQLLNREISQILEISDPGFDACYFGSKSQ